MKCFSTWVLLRNKERRGGGACHGIQEDRGEHGHRQQPRYIFVAACVCSCGRLRGTHTGGERRSLTVGVLERQYNTSLIPVWLWIQEELQSNHFKHMHNCLRSRFWASFISVCVFVSTCCFYFRNIKTPLKKRERERENKAVEQWYCHIWCNAFKIQPPSPLWRTETVPISFTFCHIANEKAAIIDIASEINYKWRKKCHNKTVLHEDGNKTQPVEDNLILIEEYLTHVCSACKHFRAIACPDRRVLLIQPGSLNKISATWILKVLWAVIGRSHYWYQSSFAWAH